MSRSDPPKHPSVLWRESEIDRQLGLLQQRSWRGRVANRVGRTLVRIGTRLVERPDTPNGEIYVNNARQS